MKLVEGSKRCMCPPLPRLRPVSLEQFRQHLHRIDSLGQRMKVRPMRGHESVLAPQVWAHDSRDHLLTDAEMHLTVNLAGLHRRSHSLFQQPHAKNGLVELAGSEHATNPGTSGNRSARNSTSPSRRPKRCS